MTSVQRELQTLEAVRGETRRLVDGLGQHRMDQRPDAETWSPGELVDHLLVTEKSYQGEIAQLVALARAGRRPYLDRLITDFPLPFVDALPRPLLSLAAIPLTLTTTFLPSAVTEGLLRTPFLRVKAPPLLTPQAGKNADDLRRGLRESFETTRSLFTDNADLDFRTFTYQHPILGLTDGAGMLRAIASHEQRHQGQLRKILAAQA